MKGPRTEILTAASRCYENLKTEPSVFFPQVKFALSFHLCETFLFSANCDERGGWNDWETTRTPKHEHWRIPGEECCLPSTSAVVQRHSVGTSVGVCLGRSVARPSKSSSMINGTTLDPDRVEKVELWESEEKERLTHPPVEKQVSKLATERIKEPKKTANGKGSVEG